MITFQQAQNRRAFLRAVYESFSFEGPRPVPVAEIADELSLTPQETGEVVESLCERGLVTLLAAEADADGSVLITYKGISAVSKLDPAAPTVRRLFAVR
jgi:hypothetical protein